MRVGSWDDSVFDDFIRMSYAGLLDAAYTIKDDAVRGLRSQIGTGKTTGISRPVYKKGRYAGKYWTAREFGNLMKSIRVVQKTGAQGKIEDQKNVRVYVGNRMAYYASIFEYSHPFLRPAFYKTQRNLIGIIQERISRGVGPGHGHG